MARTYYAHLGHLIFHVDKAPFRAQDLSRVHAYMAQIMRRCGATGVYVGGIEDHVHIVANFPLNRAVSEIVRILKVSSSTQIRSFRACYRLFHWQTGYAYLSVSPSRLEQAVEYVQNQRFHHVHRTREQEMSLILSKNGIEETDGQTIFHK